MGKCRFEKVFDCRLVKFVIAVIICDFESSLVVFVANLFECSDDSVYGSRGAKLCGDEINFMGFSMKKILPFTKKKSIDNDKLECCCAMISGSGIFSIFV